MPSPTAPRLVPLALVLAVGAALGIHGLNAPKIPGVALTGTATSAGGAPAATTTAAGQSQGSTGSSASNSAQGSSGSSQGSTSSSSSSSSSASKGPLLSSTQFAPFTYELYPAPAAQSSQAEDGFTVSVKPASGGGNALVIGAAGGGTLLKKTILTTDKVYWIETSYGDDAPGQDANYGDDGYILTDPQGYITQK